MPLRIIKKKSVLRSQPNSLADVVDRLQTDATLDIKRRRDLISACHSAARLNGRALHDLPVGVPELRALFKTLHPVQGRVSAKRFSNIRADLAAALTIAGVIPSCDIACESNAAWKDFLAHATDRHQGWALSRFARFCSARHIDPDQVTDAVLNAFHQWLDERILTNDPAKIVKSSATSFNAIVKRSHLIIALLTTAIKERRLARHLDSYPASLTADIERYCKRLSEPDLFASEGPRRALRPVTVRNIQAHIRQTLDAAVAAGYDPARFQTIADLIDMEVIKTAINHMTAQRGGAIPSGLGNILATLLALARYYVKAPPETIQALERAKARITEDLGHGRPCMSTKSQRRMDQFAHHDNIVRLASLPERLIKRADQRLGTLNAAMDAMIAAAIAVLLACPMRIKNLAQLHMTQDMTTLRKGRNTHILLHITPDKTKGRQAIDTEIEPPFSTVIARYITHHRPHLVTDPGDWLFPKASGGPRTPDHFGGLIKDRIFRETGLVVNAHLFRHFAAYVFLEAHPGGYEDVRRVVGHAKMETTTSFYAPASSKAAFKRYGDVLKGFKAGKLRR